MTQPGWGARLIGKPYICLLLEAFYALLVWGWYHGNVHWWVGLLALGGAQHAYNCYKQLKSYNAWAAEWNAMIDDGSAGHRRQAVASSRSSKTPQLSRYLLMASVVVAAGVPMLLPSAYWTHSDALFPAWLLACGCIAVQAVCAIFMHNWQSKTVSKKAAQAAAQAQDFVVAWALPRPSASPSWQAARGQLPDYCRYLLSDTTRGKSIEAGTVFRC